MSCVEVWAVWIVSVDIGTMRQSNLEAPMREVQKVGGRGGLAIRKSFRVAS